MSHYLSSKGQHLRIADMPHPYLLNALNKLRAAEPHRTAEIDAMAKEIAKREAEGTAQ